MVVMTSIPLYNNNTLGQNKLNVVERSLKCWSNKSLTELDWCKVRKKITLFEIKELNKYYLISPKTRLTKIISETDFG